VLTISIIVVVCLAAFALMPVKKKAVQESPPVGGPSYPYPSPVQQQVSIRQQMLDEEADALSNSYRVASHDAWMAEVAAKGVELLRVKPSA